VLAMKDAMNVGELLILN